MKSENEDMKMRKEYDFSKGVRGKHFKKYREGHKAKITDTSGNVITHVFTPEDGAVMLDPDVKQHFSDSESVNRALRSLIHH